MKCKNCGNEFEGNFCPHCGAKKENDEGFTFVPTTKPDESQNNKNTVKTKKRYTMWIIISLSIILFCVLIIILINHFGSQSTVDLTGGWQQINSTNSNNYQIAKITNNTIEIYWYDKTNNIASLYWAGSFTAPTNFQKSHSWISENDAIKTDAAFLASRDETKTFTYQDGQISYEVSALGMTQTFILEKTDQIPTAIETSTPQNSSSYESSQIEVPQGAYTYGDEISYKDFTVVFSSNYYFTTIDNRFSEYHGQEVVVFPVTITNNSGKTDQINPFDVSIFNSAGQKNPSIYAYFNKDLISVGDIRNGATCEAEFYSLYDGDGDYYIEFDGGLNRPNIEICLPVIK